MTTNIQETINRLRELDRTASPAPWSSQGGFISAGQASLDITNDKQSFPLMRLWADMTKGDREVNPQDDFALIIETRNALPELIAEIDRLTAENDRLHCAEKALKERFKLIFNKWRSRRRDLIRRVQAEAWAEGYLDKGAEASEAMIERGLRERAKNPYQENKE